MAPSNEHNQELPIDQAQFQALVQQQLRSAVRLALISVLEAEVSAFIGALPYERSVTRRDQRNGYYSRNLDTTVGHIEDLPVPRTRKGFKTQLFEQYGRRQAELDQAIGDMFVRGVSTCGVGLVLEQLTGTTPSPSTVSRVFHTLEEEFATWKKRELASHYDYCFADGSYFSVRRFTQHSIPAKSGRVPKEALGLTTNLAAKAKGNNSMLHESGTAPKTFRRWRRKTRLIW